MLANISLVNNMRAWDKWAKKWAKMYPSGNVEKPTSDWYSLFDEGDILAVEAYLVEFISTNGRVPSDEEFTYWATAKLPRIREQLC